MIYQKTCAILLVWICLVSSTRAQQPLVERPEGPILWRPYRGANVPQATFRNSNRLQTLLRAGRLYLTLQDAIALAIENNLDLQIERYGPLSSEWMLERQKAGGPLKGVTVGSAAVNQITSGQGVLGAEQAAGVLTTTGPTATNAQNNGTVSQIGPITPNLDPVFQNSSVWSHTTTPQPNPAISETPSLVDDARRFTSFFQQGLITGGFVQVAGNETYLRENSPTDVLNPSYAPVAQIYIRHNFLNGFGASVNNRYIRIAAKQILAARMTFEQQLIDLVANVANLYWGLVVAREDLKVKGEALDFAQKLYRDTQKRIELGAVASFNIYRVQADASSRQQELVVSQTTVTQQEVALKDVLSRNGLQDPALDVAEIVPLDRIEIPQSDDLPPLRELLAKAMQKRPDVALDKIDSEVQQFSTLGTRNGLLPQLQGIASTTGRAEAGGVNALSGQIPSSYQVGGLGNAIGQILRHDYASRSAAFVFQAPVGNHVGQGDYGVDQLLLRQGDLAERQRRNQLVVDISSQMIALRQARARYGNAVTSRALQQKLLDKEQEKFAFGSSSVDDVVNSEHALTAAQSGEVAARSQYVRARVALDQVLGETLEANHVSVDEALQGKVSLESNLPASPP